jgi:hypothetical protein
MIKGNMPKKKSPEVAEADRIVREFKKAMRERDFEKMEKLKPDFDKAFATYLSEMERLSNIEENNRK